MKWNILNKQKIYKRWKLSVCAETDDEKLHTAQMLGLASFVFALFFAPIGLLCSCVGFGKLNAVSPSAEPKMLGSARLANGYGFAFSLLMLFAEIVFLSVFFLKLQ